MAHDPRTEALADAWASIDGKSEKFWACKSDRARDAVEGYYDGYMIEAASMIERLERRGFTVVARPGLSAARRLLRRFWKLP